MKGEGDLHLGKSIWVCGLDDVGPDAGVRWVSPSKDGATCWGAEGLNIVVGELAALTGQVVDCGGLDQV